MHEQREIARYSSFEGRSQRNWLKCLCIQLGARRLQKMTMSVRRKAVYLVVKLAVSFFLSFYAATSPLPFGRICFVALVMRKGGESSWSGPWHRLYIGSFVFHVHSYQDQFIQPGWAECVLFSLGLYFVCLHCFNLFVCPHPFVFPWAVESSPLQVLALA